MTLRFPEHLDIYYSSLLAKKEKIFKPTIAYDIEGYHQTQLLPSKRAYSQTLLSHALERYRNPYNVPVLSGMPKALMCSYAQIATLHYFSLLAILITDVPCDS